MDYLKQIQLSALNLKSDFHFSPLDVDDINPFRTKINQFIETQLESENEIEVLFYISSKLKICLNDFFNEKDMLRYENTKNLIAWIDKKIDDIEAIKNDNSSIYNEKNSNEIISEPKVWAYIYFYLINTSAFTRNFKTLTEFYETIATEKCIDKDNFRKAYGLFKKSIDNRTNPSELNNLNKAISKVELISRPNSLNRAKKELKIMQERKIQIEFLLQNKSKK